MTATRHYYLGPWIWATPADDAPYWCAPSGTVGLVDLRPISPTSESGFFATAERLADEAGYLYLGGGHLSTIMLSAAMIGEWRARLQITDAIAPCTLLDLLWDTLTIYADADGDGRALPLMPTHEGVLELHLGGHSLIKSARWQGTKTPHWDKVQKVLQRGYREIRKAALEKGSRDKTTHLKWLGAMCAKYRVGEDELIPADLPREKRIKPTTTISDAFTDTDGVLCTNHTPTDGAGWAWGLATANNQITGNRLVETSTSEVNGRADVNLSGSDMYAQVDGWLGGVVSTDGAGACVRFAATALTYYAVIYSRTNSCPQIYKRVTGTFTTLGSPSAKTYSAGGTIKCVADGSSISSYYGGAAGETITDTAIESGLRAGFRIRGGTGVTEIDNFEAADLLASASTQLIKMMQY